MATEKGSRQKTGGGNTTEHDTLPNLDRKHVCAHKAVAGVCPLPSPRDPLPCLPEPAIVPGRAQHADCRRFVRLQSLETECTTVDHDNQAKLLGMGVNVGDVSMGLDACLQGNGGVCACSRLTRPLQCLSATRCRREHERAHPPSRWHAVAMPFGAIAHSRAADTTRAAADTMHTRTCRITLLVASTPWALAHRRLGGMTGAPSRNVRRPPIGCDAGAGGSTDTP